MDRRRLARERRAKAGSKADAQAIRREAVARGERVQAEPGDLVEVLEALSPWIARRWQGIVTEVSKPEWPCRHVYVLPLPEWRGHIVSPGDWDRRRGLKLSSMDEITVLEVGRGPLEEPERRKQRYPAVRLRDGRWVHQDCLWEASKPIDSRWRSLAVQQERETWPFGESCAICGGKTVEPRSGIWS